MDFLKSSKRRSFVSESLYIALNVGLAVAILITVLLIESPVLAFALVLLGKWRTLAVRPRYWFANVQANLVDVIVSISVVVLLYAASGAFAMQCLLTLLYVGWLLVIKPRSKRLFITIQSGTAVFLGTLALLIASPGWIASGVVLAMWLIGYASARHILSNHDEAHTSFYSLVWAFIFAELGWLLFHWTFAYSLPGIGGIKLAQGALIVLAISFIVERGYSSYTKRGTIVLNDIILPVLLSVSTIAIIMLFFNTLSAGAI